WFKGSLIRGTPLPTGEVASTCRCPYRRGDHRLGVPLHWQQRQPVAGVHAPRGGAHPCRRGADTAWWLMRFRLHGDTLHVHRCTQHPAPCDFFDHAPAWLFTNRDAAREQLIAYRISVVTRIASLQAILASIDLMLGRLALVKKIA